MTDARADGELAVSSSWRPALILGLALTMAAGFVDALGYLRLGQLYVSFMSGNSTRFGMALAAGDFGLALWSGAVISVFVAGAFLGVLLTEEFSRVKLLLALLFEITCTVVAFALSASSADRATLLPVVLAMGLQNAVHQVVVGADTGKSFVTGTLFGIGNALAQRVLGRGHVLQAGVHGLSWIAFAGGVVVGSLCLAHLGLAVALLVVTGVLSVLAVVAGMELSAAARQ